MRLVSRSSGAEHLRLTTGGPILASAYSGLAADGAAADGVAVVLGHAEHAPAPIMTDDITEIIRHHWDRRAPIFDDQAGHGLVSDDQRRAWLDLFSRLSGRSQQVLDVGCGTGFLALIFAELGHTVTGIDLSPLMIDRALSKAERAGFKIDFRVGDASALDCDDEIYDVVVARHVVWNLPNPEQGVAEWLRVLRPGGRLIVIEGKWADDEAVATKGRHRFRESFKDAIVEISVRSGIHPKRLRKTHRFYRRVERELPYWGGPPADRLVDLLERLSVVNIEVESLMDPTLWEEPLEFPRYLISGTRPD
jgi:ubiquinone/menaquinone biosynthesis C-methylase UbiE